MATTIDSPAAEPGALGSPWQQPGNTAATCATCSALAPADRAWLGEHASQPVGAAQMSDFLAQEAPTSEESLKRALRQLRQRVMATLIVRDLGGAAPLSEVVESMTQLADVTTNFALDFLHRQLSELFGEPLDSAGQPQRLLIIGMGKLGGRELNVSSDVDYIFVYPEEGQTGGKSRRIDNYDFFLRLGKRLISALGDLTEDGQVFRVDMRLRPNGDSGALVGSLGSLENYFITQGREWERYAWIKARVMNEGVNLQPQWVAALQSILPPLCLPQVSRLWRDQRHARPACPDSPRSRAQGHGRAHQARPGRNSRNRVHRPGLPVDSRRP
jgi:glutamine synthetase adenylyltransferase